MGDHRTFFEALTYLAEQQDLATLAYILGDAELIRIDAVTGERPTSPNQQAGRSFFSAEDANGGVHLID